MKVTLLLAVAAFYSSAVHGSPADKMMDSHRRSIASESMVLEVSSVRDRPFTIQVASHLNELNAIEHVERLQKGGHDAFYYPNFIKNQVLFKVCVGRFANENEAAKYHTAFAQETNENLSIVASLMARPGSDRVATQALLKGLKNVEREIASTPKAAVSSSEIGKKIYSLQVAAFPTEKLAQEHQEKLKKQFGDQEVFYRSADIAGKTWYRIFVGRYSEFALAEQAQKTLKNSSVRIDAIVRKLFE